MFKSKNKAGEIYAADTRDQVFFVNDRMFEEIVRKTSVIISVNQSRNMQLMSYHGTGGVINSITCYHVFVCTICKHII